MRQITVTADDRAILDPFLAGLTALSDGVPVPFLLCRLSRPQNPQPRTISRTCQKLTS